MDAAAPHSRAGRVPTLLILGAPSALGPLAGAGGDATAPMALVIAACGIGAIVLMAR